MTITASHVKDIRQEFATLKPATVTLDGQRSMTVKEAILALAPTLEREARLRDTGTCGTAARKGD